jgi:hypothetical protein
MKFDTPAGERDLSRALDREQAQVAWAVESLQDELKHLRQHPPTSASSGRLAATLLHLRLHLGRHFGIVEQSGFFDQLARGASTRASVQDLLHDHSKLDTEYARLLRIAHCAALGSGALDKAFFAAVEDSLACLARHEQEERRLQGVLASNSSDAVS